MQKYCWLMCCTFSWGCITEYHAIIEENPNEILVVEGFITNDTTYIVLSKTVSLVYAGESVYVNDASLYVECDNEIQSFASQYIGNGKYRIYTGALHTDQKYRLRILTNKDEYQSEFLAPVFTPEIDSIFWIKEGSKQPVSICVSTHDPLNQSPYYFWSYEEDWEITAPIYATAVYVNGPLSLDPLCSNYYWPQPIMVFDADHPNDRYYCWKSDHSKNILLGSTEKLSENRLSGEKILTKEYYDDRWSELYRIRVNQNMIRKEAYDYYSNLQKNVEQTGSVFSPIPSEMKGNITCITNLAKLTIGYTEVSVTTRKTSFIRKSDNLFEIRYSLCRPLERCMLVQIIDITGNAVNHAPLECVDCRERGGTKKKPDNWPNNHQ